MRNFPLSKILLASLFAIASFFINSTNSSFISQNVQADEPTVEIAPSFPYVDYHYHVFEEKSTPQTALETQRATGIRRGVLENVGRDSIWVVNNNEELKAFIDSVAETDALLKPGEPRLLIGLQVNDRDWFRKIDLKQYRRLDYILADAMYYTDRSGRQFGLWDLPRDYDVDVDAWFDEYYEYNINLLDEPIDVFANPTYLPAFAEAEYDRLWTPEKSRALIQKAIDANVAFEIQAASPFPNDSFIELARDMGARFVFGTNNFDGNPVDCSRWEEAIKKFELTEKNMFVLPKR